MTSQARMKLQVWLLILVVFVLGGVTGASLDRLYIQKQNPDRYGRSSSNVPRRQRMLEKMKRDLNLSDDQATAIRTIFDETDKEFHSRRFSECPGFKEMREKTRSRIRAVLTPEQQKRYDERTAAREAEKNQR